MRHGTEYRYHYYSYKIHILEKAELLVYQNSTIFRDTHTISTKVLMLQYQTAQKNWEETLMIKEQWDTTSHLPVQYTDAPHSSDYLSCFGFRRSESINWLWLFWLSSFPLIQVRPIQCWDSVFIHSFIIFHKSIIGYRHH